MSNDFHISQSAPNSAPGPATAREADLLLALQEIAGGHGRPDIRAREAIAAHKAPAANAGGLTFDEWYTGITVEGPMHHNMRRAWDAAMVNRAPAADAVGVCAEMRALCSNCGGTGEVHRADGEYLGTCDCMFRTIDTPAATSAAGQWQPIETAPLDGREVLLKVEVRAGIPGKQLVGHYMPGGYCIEDHPAIDKGWYFWNGCMFDQASKPTHWMPLPEDRAAAKGAAGREGGAA